MKKIKINIEDVSEEYKLLVNVFRKFSVTFTCYRVIFYDERHTCEMTYENFTRFIMAYIKDKELED